MSTPSSSGCGSVGPLEVHGQDLNPVVGEKVVLALWSNRENDTDLQYEWSLSSAPVGTRQVIVHPSGVSTRNAPGCRQVYIHGDIPNFVGDVPGLYVFEVRAVELSTGTLALGQVNLTFSPVVHTASPDVGCSMGGGGPLLLAVLLLLRRVWGAADSGATSGTAPSSI